ncbi:hypothetical protein SNEBB_007344 [Seison nebaliae]|nr:hypothetical protein SNEBB_007344 [Seison nebaliae]
MKLNCDIIKNELQYNLLQKTIRTISKLSSRIIIHFKQHSTVFVVSEFDDCDPWMWKSINNNFLFTNSTVRGYSDEANEIVVQLSSRELRQCFHDRQFDKIEKISIDLIKKEELILKFNIIYTPEDDYERTCTSELTCQIFRQSNIDKYQTPNLTIYKFSLKLNSINKFISTIQQISIINESATIHLNEKNELEISSKSAEGSITIKFSDLQILHRSPPDENSNLEATFPLKKIYKFINNQSGNINKLILNIGEEDQLQIILFYDNLVSQCIVSSDIC